VALHDRARRRGQPAFHPRGERFSVDTLIRRLPVSVVLPLSQQDLNRSIAVVSHYWSNPPELP
jgi:hypothetical protein